jgi:hypothetical protein
MHPIFPRWNEEFEAAAARAAGAFLQTRGRFQKMKLCTKNEHKMSHVQQK